MSAVIGVSAYTIVEAASIREAIRIAKDRQPLIDKNDGNSPHDVWLVEEADGTPRKITVEEMT